MRVVKMMAAMAALACAGLAGQAQAAKVWDYQFTISPDQPYATLRPDIGAGQQQMILRFSSPVTGWADLPDDVNVYMYYRNQLEWANNENGLFGTSFTNATQAKFDAGCRLHPAAYVTRSCSWYVTPTHFNIGLTGLQSPVSVRATVWASVPEPATWALMILGMGAVGGAMRRRRYVPAQA